MNFYKLVFIIIYFCTFSVCATTLSVVSGQYQYHEAREFKAMMAQLKPHGDFSAKAPPREEVVIKEMSRGERMVEEARARNRAVLARRNLEDKEVAEKSGRTSEMALLKEQHRRTLEGWKKEVEETHRQWKKEQDIFLGRIKEYKQNTFVIPVKKETIIEKKVAVENIPDVHIVNGAFTVPVRDQRARPTCAAFAGVRAIEILLAQNKEDKDLSEQYFYWASKPDCQKSPCDRKGSWVTTAYRYSQSHKNIDIPLETNCTYNIGTLQNNETQLPLAQGCNEGATKVNGFEEIRTLADVVERLKKNVPVIMAARLSENFYRNQGLVTLADSSKSSGKMDAHALGHAFLAVGVIELPEKLQESEGNFCVVVANSWGKGWGAGGHSCLTEKWLAKFRQPSPFVAVSKISIK